MEPNRERLAPAERRALFYAPLYRILGTPAVAVLGLANTAIIVRESGAEVFGLVSLIAAVTLLFPFADLGIGATVLNASASLSGPGCDPRSVDVIRRGYHVLFTVAGLIILAALGVMALDGWSTLVGFSSGPDDRWAITAAVGVFALTIPAGLGVRILVGIDRNPLATLVLMSCPAFALLVTGLLYLGGASGIWYALSALTGLLIGQVVGTVLALRISGLGWAVLGPVNFRSGRGLLAGSGWLFVVGIGLPVGLQTGRVVLAHLSTPSELSKYSLMAQIYGVVWSVLSTAGLAYWPAFVKRRGAAAATVRMWWRLTAALGGAAVIAALTMTALAPWAASMLSGGRIDVSATLGLGFGGLLIGQALHLPATVLLTRPDEARWQAAWTVVMAAISIGLGCAVAGAYGALGVVCAAALGAIAAQVIPDLLWVPRLVSRRPGQGD